jgi:L-ascorbate metabolism protein UlaG (beta-lactamase superfamily)
MEITWYGLSCFKLTERGSATVVTDPYDCQKKGQAPLSLPADIVTISRDAPGHNAVACVKGTPYIISGPGEYEVGGVFVTGIQITAAKGTEDLHNTLYVYVFDTLTVAHLGELNRLPTQAEVEAMGTVNIALVPISGGPNLNASRAAEIISLLEPNIVIPMHCADPESQIPLDSLSKFLKEMGLSEVQTQPSLKITSANLPEETRVVVLEDQLA